MSIVNADFVPTLVGHSKDEPFTWSEVILLMKWVERNTREETKQNVASKLSNLILRD